MRAQPDSYVVYGSVPWNTPRLTEQNLAASLGATQRVLYMEPPITPATPFRFGLRRETKPLLRALFDRRVRAAGPVHAFRPLMLPPRGSELARRLSRPLLQAQVRWATRRLGMRRPVALWAHANAPLRGAAGEVLSVYIVKDWLEAGGVLVGQRESEIAAARREMWNAVDLICVTSSQLQRTLTRRGYDSTLLKHGFHADLAGLYDSPAPDDYRDLPRPLLAYAGRIDGRLDYDLLAAVADRFAGGSIVLMGPVSPRVPKAELERLAARSNVHLLGPRGRTELPPYLAAADCNLLPYKEGEWSRHGSPLKLWDYLYAGPPIVGTGYGALREYPPPLVHFVSGADAVGDAIRRALEEDEGRDVRRRLALENSWDVRASALDGLVHHAMAERAGRAAIGRTA
jgi:teichuronic acid biosynthesis glycosyltransferase TuaH